MSLLPSQLINNKIMEQSIQPNNAALLQNLFNQRSPKTKYFSESRIQQFTQSIAKQIINGDTVINPHRDDSVAKPKNRYEQDQRRQKLVQASQEKQELEKKLSYLNKSIESIKKYSYIKAQNQAINLTKSGEKSPEELQQSRQQGKELAQSIRKHKEKIQKIRLQEMQKKREQRQKQIQIRKKTEQREKQNRKKEILQNLKKIKQSMQQRELQNQKSTQKVKEIINKKNLFHKMEEQYKQKEATTLQERKRKLTEIRNLHKPIDISEINEHQKKVEELKREKEDIRMREKKINASSVKYQVPYMGAFYREILDKKTENNDLLQGSKLKVDKVKQFAEHIRENFMPHVDQQRRQELQKSIQKESELKRFREQKLQENIQLLKSKGVEYTQFLRKLPKKRNPSKVQEQGSKTARPIYKNYLSHSISQDSPHKTDQAWTKILTRKELNKKDKARLLQYESQKVEEILKRKQQEGRLLKKNNEDDIDQEYYNMIKAKLSLLTSQS